MRIETISTGDEVITGFIDDTNFSWFAQNLLDSGLQIQRHQTVADNLQDLINILSERSKIADIVLVNGGLGPTSDDKTSEAVAKTLNVPLVRDETCVAHIESFFKKRGRTMNSSNLKQAMLPHGASVIPNELGSACGYSIKINNATCYFTPGVPSEFKAMVNNFIIQDIRRLAHQERTEVLRYFVLGMSESSIGGMLDREVWPENIVLGYRVASPIVEVKIICKNATADNIHKAEQKLLSFIEPCLVSKHEFNLPSLISKLSGVVPLQVMECGTGGLVLSALSEEIPFMTGHLMPLSGDAHELAKKVRTEKQRTIAIGAETELGFPVVYWNGIEGYVQQLKSKHPLLKARKKLITCAVLDMTRRILSGKNPFPPYETLERTYSDKF